MKRALTLCLVISGATAASAVGAAPPRAQLGSFVCRKASNQLNRLVAVTAVMRPVSGTERMALKFELQRKAAGRGAFVDVRGGDLGQWGYPSDPSTLGQQPSDIWRKTKEVVNLSGPAVYRYRVAFRWSGTGGRVLQSTVQLTGGCSERK